MSKFINHKTEKAENTELQRTIGNNLRKYRTQNGYTQEALAEKAGISTTFYANIERGGKGMSVFTLKKLSDSLEISTDYLLNKETSGTRLKNIEMMLENKPEKFLLMVEKIIRAMNDGI